MKRRAWLALAVVLFGCATPPQQPPELNVDTGTNRGEATDPRNRARLHTELASLYFSRGNMAVALEELRFASEADPTYPPIYGMFGLVYMELRENRLAEQSFQNGLRIAPQDPDLNHNYGWYLCQNGHEAESLKYFENALRNPLYVRPWRSNSAAGTCSMRAGNVKLAEAYFERALKDDPDELGSLLQLAQIRYRESRMEDARRLVTRFNRLVQPTAESLWLALRIERRLNAPVAEQALGNQLRRRFPASQEYQLLQRGEYD